MKKSLFVVFLLSSVFTPIIYARGFSEPSLAKFSHKRQGHVPTEKYPWHVFIDAGNCSGVVVKERWILTSALCARDLTTQRSTAGLSLILNGGPEGDRSVVFLRVRNRSMSRNFFGTYAVPVMKAFVFPKYNTRTSTDNFGLLYLARKAVLRNTQRISLIKLPDVKLLTSLSLTRNFSSTILGWGQNSFGLKLPQRFKEGGNVSADRVCPHRSSEDETFHPVGLEKSWCFVAGTQGMPSIDRGSPLVVKRNRTWVIIGVYSRGETRRSYKHTTLFSRIDASVLAWMTKLFAVGGERLHLFVFMSSERYCPCPLWG